jgi:hypothetical protein
VKRRRLLGVLVGSGFRAAPGIMTLVLALNIAARVANTLSPLLA